MHGCCNGKLGGKSPPFFMCGCAQRRQAIYAGVKALANADINSARAEASTFIRSAVSDLAQLRRGALVSFALRILLLEIHRNQEKIMSALSDGIAAVQASLSKLQTDNAKAFSDLEAAVAAGDPTDVANAVSALSAINTALQSMDTAALAADPANAAPAPAPVPSPKNHAQTIRAGPWQAYPSASALTLPRWARP
jgi:hypothetical protein